VAGRIPTKGRIARGEPRRGSAIVEFALMLPLLLTLTLLCVDFGRFAHYYIAVTNAARAGAAYASANVYATGQKSAWDSQVKQAVIDELTNNSWFDSNKLIVPSPIVTQEASGLWRVQVDVSYPFQTLFDWPFVDRLSPPSMERHYHEPLILHRAVVMRRTI
jgi:Flp pilus assembly protein TadG